MTSEFPPQPGGIGTHALHFANHLQEQGFDVQVLTDQRSMEGTPETLFDQTLIFKVHRIPVHRFRVLMYLKRVQQLFKLINSADTIIASGKFSLWMVAFASLFYKKTYVAVVHGTEVNFKSPLLRTSVSMSLKRFAKVICVSNYTKSLIAHLNLKEVIVIPNGIDLNRWQNPAQEPINLPGHPKLVTVGHVSERKGQLNVIRHLPDLLKVFPKLQYHCVGLPTEQDNFLVTAKALGVEGHVTFHGRVDETHLKQILLDCDLFVMLSSMTASGDVEGFGIAILESNALGLPAIGSLGCGIEDAIAEGQSGRLIDPTNAKAFIDAMTAILSDYERYSAAAKDWAVQHDWKRIVGRYVEVLESRDDL